jgi:hypothetical protein
MKAISLNQIAKEEIKGTGYEIRVNGQKVVSEKGMPDRFYGEIRILKPVIDRDYMLVSDGMTEKAIRSCPDYIERYKRGTEKMEIDGQVTISLKTFNQLQDRAKQADELKKRMRDLQEEITDIIDRIDETEAEPIFREIDDSNMTDKQIQKRFDEAIAKFRIILDPEKTKRLIQKYIEKDRSDSHADVKNASRKVLEQITITMKAEEE